MILGLIALISAGVGAASYKLYIDSKKLIEVMKPLLSSLQEMQQEIVDANADGAISNEEFTKLLDKSNELVKKITEAMAQAKLVVDDFIALKDEVLKFIHDYQTNHTSGAK